MKDANRWVGSGRLVRDPERKDYDSGNTRADFTLAVNRGRDKNGKDKGAYFVNCVAWGPAAKTILEYGAKGRRVLVSDSSLFIRKYDKDGEMRYYSGLNVREIQFMDDRKKLQTNPDYDRAMEGGDRRDASEGNEW